MPDYKQFPAWLKLIIKLSFTALCLWYVSKKIDWDNSLATIQRSNILWLLAATLLFVASKVVASFRLNFYFRNIDLHITESKNLRLYWQGMFYNLFLPGGIGGDAYKVILLTRAYSQSAKLLTAAVLLDRLSGIVGLSILALIYYYFVNEVSNYPLLFLLLILPGIAFYYYSIKKVFPSFLKAFCPTLWLGIIVQSLQVLCAYTIMLALHLYSNHTEYIFIFLLSSIVTILPFTIGGLGAREIVFIWGSNQFLLNKDESVCISLLFYLITVITSLAGLIWVYKNPVKKSGKIVEQEMQ